MTYLNDTLISANWPAPSHIQAGTTTLMHGHSQEAYASNNLALHVGDNPAHVLANRQQLRSLLMLPNDPAWLEQTHSTDCVIIENEASRHADAAITRQKTQPLAILTADCLPILLCDKLGTEIAAIHAGWRGLLNGVVQNTLKKMHVKPHDLLAWIGPAICQRCYEVGDDVRMQFTSVYPFTTNAFEGRYANLPYMAELVLKSLGIHHVYQSHVCTFEEKKTCYSYRRTSQTGRMATLIWFNQEKDNA
jgi:YfiH family protein